MKIQKVVSSRLCAFFLLLSPQVATYHRFSYARTPSDSDRIVYVSRVQKFFTYAGYYANTFAREAIRDIERITRFAPEESLHVIDRIEAVVFAVFSTLLAAVLLVPSFLCYILAASMGGGRFELIELESPSNVFEERSVKVMSLNACLQDPWSPITGGVVPPFESVPGHLSRIAGLVDAIAKEDPLLFLGQEFENLGAQDEAIRLMREKGFSYFLRDLGSYNPVCNPSGFFVASKVPLKNIEFIPYPSSDRVGLAKLSGQGALTFTISVQGEELRFVNVHLNYGYGEANQEARNRQLTQHVIPLLTRGKAVVLGDLNFDTASVDRVASGLLGLVNELEGRVTCSDEGKHFLRGKSRDQCSECEEKIDGLIYNPEEVAVVDCVVKPLTAGSVHLSDHYATIATIGRK